MNTLIEQINTVGKSFVDFATPMLIQSSVLIIILFALDILLRKKLRAVFRYWIWMIVLVKLMLPPTLALPTSPVYWFSDKIHNPVSNAPIPEETQTYPHAAYHESPSHKNIATAGFIANETSYTEQNSTTSIIEPKVQLSWQGYVFIIWLISIVIMISLLIQRTFFIKRLISQSQKANEKLTESIERARLQMKLKNRVELRLSETAISPSVCGLFKPTILIPKTLAEKINVNDLKAILLHELAHIKRYDLWVNLVQAILQIIYIYNPLLWIANIVIRNVREQAVDEMVLVAMGEQAEEYPKTLLNISRYSFGSATLSLRLIGVAESKKALFSRIKHITTKPFPTSTKLGLSRALTIIIAAFIFLPMARAEKSFETEVENISSPYTSTANSAQSPYELIRQAQTGGLKPGDTPKAETSINMRILHFPKERSLGKLFIESGIPSVSMFPWSNIIEPIKYESFGFARGDVNVPEGKRVKLILDSWTWRRPENLAVLKQLNPDDLYSLILSDEYGPPTEVPPNSRCMSYLAHLTGLKYLVLSGAAITATGLQYLTELKSLEGLQITTNLTDAGFNQVCKLTSIKGLIVRGNNRITDVGLSQISNLKSLEHLEFSSNSIKGEGLKSFSELPSLNYLSVGGDFPNDAFLYLKGTASLRILCVGGLTFNDQGMKSISELSQLEHFNAHWITNITDEGAAYIKDMPDLKSLDLEQAKLTDSAMISLKQIKTLEFLHLPNNGINDTGMQHIVELKNLKYLWVGGTSISPLTDKSLHYVGELKNLEQLNIGGEGFSDEGMKEIAKLTNLKRLSLFKADLLTDSGLAELENLKSLEYFYLGNGTKVSVSGLSSLNGLKNLKVLNIRDIHQDNSSVMDISGLENLEQLTLFLHRVRKNGTMDMVTESFRDEDWKCLAGLTKLSNLQITGLGISNEGMKNLSSLNNLYFLNIICPSETKITDEALKYLVNMNKINRLHIKDGHFTDKALDYLEGLPSLTWLELTSDYAISSKAIRDFQSKKPNIDHLVLIP